MPDGLGYHGCAVTTKNNGVQYLAIIGGQNSSTTFKSSIYLLNLATKQWETYPNIILPLSMSPIIGAVALQLEQQGDRFLITSSVLKKIPLLNEA